MFRNSNSDVHHVNRCRPALPASFDVLACPRRLFKAPRAKSVVLVLPREGLHQLFARGAFHP